ncbi:MAG: phosphate ABC transporter permease subunit PstC [Candidatus Dactylopiibacterium carminicum]|uniref:Phosphate transport system permease protein n=1 Tax=Candidatus Dactylopiibacterium carminicum TaxID=857335 RepID=A0A272EU16_9RHOO|nr:phosphate ABC transporter permease subunit PstC [Candidatus Dactylopiibacterium carminicum]PAS93240.1 MAG: phosphate ABC transporter permease subunit PstC [Candidatus Dactylopiibacterium carminicum]
MDASLAVSKDDAQTGGQWPPVVEGSGEATRKRVSSWQDAGFAWLVRLVAVFVLVAMSGIVIALVYDAWPVLNAFGLDFLISSEWNPPMDRYGALVLIYGTLVTSAIALFIAVPVSFGIAIFLTELSPAWLRRPLGTAIELLAAIPSIVYGMWGLLVFAPVFATHVQPLLASTLGKIPFLGVLFSGPPLGIGLLTAGIVLAIMIIPFIASVMRDVFEITPPMIRESAYGLGCTTWEVVWRIVLPYSKTGVVGGVMLGLGRALGETMAVTFVIGNTSFLTSPSLFMPGNSATSAIANEFAEAAPGLHTSALIGLALMLFLITLVVLMISRFMLSRMKKH